MPRKLLVNRNLDREKKKKKRIRGEFPLSQNISINKFHESLTVKNAARMPRESRLSRLSPSFANLSAILGRIIESEVRTKVEFPLVIPFR